MWFAYLILTVCCLISGLKAREAWDKGDKLDCLGWVIVGIISIIFSCMGIK